MDDKKQLDGKRPVLLLVRYVNEDRVAGLYVRNLRLSFMPTVGMQFLRSGVSSMWVTNGRGEVTPPKVESVIYDFDEGDDYKGGDGLTVCTFTVYEELTSTFWEQHLEGHEIPKSHYRDYLLSNR